MAATRRQRHQPHVPISATASSSPSPSPYVSETSDTEDAFEEPSRHSVQASIATISDSQLRVVVARLLIANPSFRQAFNRELDFIDQLPVTPRPRPRPRPERTKSEPTVPLAAKSHSHWSSSFAFCVKCRQIFDSSGWSTHGTNDACIYHPGEIPSFYSISMAWRDMNVHYSSQERLRKRSLRLCLRGLTTCQGLLLLARLRHGAAVERKTALEAQGVLLRRPMSQRKRIEAYIAVNCGLCYHDVDGCLSNSYTSTSDLA